MIETIERKKKLPAAGKGRLAIPKVGRKAATKATKMEWKPAALTSTQTLNLDPTIIQKSPFQTRREFDAEKIASLGASMLAHGQASAISVRTTPGGGFELMTGERRLRAAIEVGMAAIRADVFECDDSQARQIVIAENLHREDLNAIEEARAFRMLIDAGEAAGPTELAKQLNVSQGHVSNRLRLLELPEAIQAKVISREISATQARTIAAYSAVPAIMEAVVEAIDDDLGCPAGELTTHDFEVMVDEAARSRSVKIDLPDGTEIYPLTPKQIRELKIIEVADVRRATNMERWREIKAENTQSSDDSDTEDSQSSGVGDADPIGEPGSFPDPHDAAADKVCFQRRLWYWYCNWLRSLIADKLLAGYTYENNLMLLAALLPAFSREGGCDDLEVFEDSIADLGIRTRGDLVGAILSLEGSEARGVVGGVLARYFVTADGEPHCDLSDDHLESIAICLSVLPEDAWLEHQANRFSEAYWDLHTYEQLLLLAKELKVKFTAQEKATKESLVAAFLAKIPKEEDIEAGLMYPKELKKIKAPK